ncbi:PEP-CTERM sorting domain-containing protein [Salinisphaera sp. T31B1]|uniref:PEP-CTERM sorting domain-containing protein n=1 Tax=Salinisphaera sp. T31B1 TaxID=727963 RepID=UPI0033413AD5
MKRLVSGVLFFLSVTAAHASVTYEWQALSGTDDFTTTSGELVVTTAAYRAGGLVANDTIDYYGSPYGARSGGSAVLHARLDILGSNGWTYRIQAYPRQSLLSGVGNPMFYSLQADMNIEREQAMLSGSLSLLTVEDEFSMSAGSDGLWTIDYFNSDGAPENCFVGRCGGATGRWVLSDAAIGVPEPQSLLLTGLACIAAFGVRRRLSARTPSAGVDAA